MKLLSTPGVQDTDGPHFHTFGLVHTGEFMAYAFYHRDFAHLPPPYQQAVDGELTHTTCTTCQRF